MSVRFDIAMEDMWSSHDDHILYDLQRMDDVLVANEQVRYEAWAESLEFDDPEDEV